MANSFRLSTFRLKSCLFACALLSFASPYAAAQIVSDIRAKFVDCHAEVTCNLTAILIADLTLWYSADLGQTYHRCDSVSGDLNAQASGSKTIIWDCFAEGIRFGGVKFKVTARDIIEMVAVKGGTFTMGCTAEQGSDCSNDELPLHTVTLSDFYISKYEVTQAQWRVVMDSSYSHFNGEDLPMVAVNWDDAQEFLQTLSLQAGKTCRLPTEAEWEFAARGGTLSAGYKYSGSNNVDDVAWYLANSDSIIHPVGSKQQNELGIYDMSGNAWEWCSDWYSAYDNAPQTNPTGGTTGSDRIVRGGGTIDRAWGCRVSTRSYTTPNRRYSNVSFRVVLP
ncbi:MAG: formylglycine-generating enzyme family protein [Prevotellaceae bacterium]|jgi:formylglycine-generating enzyme required for sulfatase activity|nr:formylglycine-generating enzyme family protein [Prevotellaceae bacterium]